MRISTRFVSSLLTFLFERKIFFLDGRHVKWKTAAGIYTHRCTGMANKFASILVSATVWLVGLSLRETIKENLNWGFVKEDASFVAFLRFSFVVCFAILK